MIRIEDHLLRCNLCFDAAEGIEELNSGDDAEYHLNQSDSDLKILVNTGFRTGRFRFYISAAAFFLLACTAALLMFRKSSAENLFEEYYKPYPNIVPMVRGDEGDFDLRAAMILYNSGNFQQALTEFDKILSLDSKNETALFYKGISCLSLKKGEKAEINFKRVLDIPGGKLRDQAQWYLALSYLLNKDTGKAINVLAEIISENNYYSASAEYLSKRLTGRND